MHFGVIAIDAHLRNQFGHRVGLGWARNVQRRGRRQGVGDGGDCRSDRFGKYSSLTFPAWGQDLVKDHPNGRHNQQACDNGTAEQFQADFSGSIASLNLMASVSTFSRSFGRLDLLFARP